MKRLLIAEDLPLGQNLCLDDLQRGQLGIFGMHTTLAKLEPVRLDQTYDTINIVLGQTQLPSDEIDSLGRHHPRKLELIHVPFCEGYEQKWRVSIDGDGDSALDEYSLRLGQVFEDVNDVYGEEYSFQGSIVNNKKAIYEAWAKDINEESRLVDAVVDAAGLVLTVKTRGIGETLIDGIQPAVNFIHDDNKCNHCPCFSFTATELVKGKESSGTAQDLRRLDWEYRAHKSLGDYDDKRNRFPYVIGDSPADLEKQFDKWIILYSNRDHAGGDQGREVFEMHHTLIIATPVGAEVAAELKHAVETLTGRKFITRV